MSSSAPPRTTRVRPRSTTCSSAGAAQVVVVADSSKVGRRAFARICPIDRIDTLVTDERLPDEHVGRLSEAGVKVIRA
uniref:hypothetical protein n=1 Tax=Nonomuraea dietziae TaxID=65515 RepID=UPI0035E40DB2